MTVLRVKDPSLLCKVLCKSGEASGGQGFVLRLRPVGRVERERDIVSYLYKWPEELLFTHIGGGRVVVKCREFHNADLLFITDKGEVYIVEAKRSESGRLRQALAQAFEYASSIWSNYQDNAYELLNEIRESGNCEVIAGEGASPDSVLDDLIQALNNNISRGMVNIVIATDSISDTLKTTINFLAGQVRFKIIAVELVIYRDESGSLELVVPNIYAPSIQQARSSKEKASITGKLSMVDDEKLRERMERLMRLAEAHGKLAASTGRDVVFIVQGASGKTMLSVYKDGSMDFYLGSRRDDNFKSRRQKEEVVEKLKNLGLLDKDYTIDSHPEQKRLAKRLGELTEEQFRELLQIIEDIIS